MASSDPYYQYQQQYGSQSSRAGTQGSQPGTPRMGQGHYGQFGEQQYPSGAQDSIGQASQKAQYSEGSYPSMYSQPTGSSSTRRGYNDDSFGSSQPTQYSQYAQDSYQRKYSQDGAQYPASPSAHQQNNPYSDSYNRGAYGEQQDFLHPQQTPDIRGSTDSFLHQDVGYRGSTEMFQRPPVRRASFASQSSYGAIGPGNPQMDASVSRVNLVAAGGRPNDSMEPLYKIPEKQKPSRKRALWFWIVLAVILLAAAGVCVYLFVIRPRMNGDKDNDGKDTNTNKPPPPTVLIGRDGDTVTMEDGTNFTYHNTFGGWFIDADKSDNPFNDGARAQSYTPALNETWDFANNRIFGVNIGGWLVLEPFITPLYYQRYDKRPGFDSSEWALTEMMAADTANGGIETLKNHYATFITEQDFAEIAAAGLNWVRLPIAYWAIEAWEGEPFLEQLSWQYALKAFKWARKYGLRVNLDLHCMPGSQNGWNHSGKMGPINWMSGPMGVANAQRSLDYMRIIVEFISQPQYKNLVPIFGIVNEPMVDALFLEQFYLQAYTMIRGITGIGAGNGPYISIHDRFNTSRWTGFLAGADRLALDTHRYFAFDGRNKPEIDEFVFAPCTAWGRTTNTTMNNFGVTAVGELSLGYNDCGLYLTYNGQRDMHNTQNCEFWDNYRQWPEQTKTDLYNFMLSEMEGARNFFFWTWKIGAAQSGEIQAPLWSYKLGLSEGWITKDPRESEGHCARHGHVGDPEDAFVGSYAPSATGGPGAPQTLDPAAVATVAPWPPTRLYEVDGEHTFPSFTPTGPIHTLPAPTLGPQATVTLNGWANPQDTAGAMVPITGCTYPENWVEHEPDTPIPPPCTGA